MALGLPGAGAGRRGRVTSRGAIGLFLRSAVLVILALALAVSLVGGAVFVATSGASASLAIYLLVSAVVMTDFVDLVARLYLRKLQSGLAAFAEVPATARVSRPLSG